MSSLWRGLSRGRHDLICVLTGSLKLPHRRQTREQEGESRGLVEATAIVQLRDGGGLDWVVPVGHLQSLAWFEP